MDYVALKMLIGDKLKFITLIAGLTFSVLLINQQGSIFCGLMLRSAATVLNTNVPIWVVDKSLRYVEEVKPLPDTAVNSVRSVEGVKWAVPSFYRLLQAKMQTGLYENIQLIGVDDVSFIGLPQKVIAGDLMHLSMPDAVIIDKAGNRKFGNLKVGDTFEINDRLARVVAIIDIRENFQTFPIVYTTYQRALEYAPKQRRQLSYILADAQPGYSLQQVAQNIEKKTGFAAYTQSEFFWLAIQYILQKTGIAINFGITVTLGALVGISIAGQTFYTFTLENIRHFGVLKAIGVSNLTLVRMILLQSLLVGFIGYGIGVGAVTIFANLIKGTRLAFFLPKELLLISCIAIIGICILASIISIMKVIRTEPSIVFRA